METREDIHFTRSKGDSSPLNTSVQPTRFRFTVIGQDDLKLLRRIKNMERRGLVTSISFDQKNNIVIEFGQGKQSLVLSSADDHVFIHSASPWPLIEVKSISCH